MTHLDQSVIAHRYQLQNTLGQGGMGVVYHAFDRLTRQTVALKQVLVGSNQLAFTSISQNNSAGHRLALAREFQLLASLRHPYIISVLDYGFDEQQQPFFTMTLLERPSSICQTAPHLDINGRVELVIQMLQALAYLHRRGIVHRDLKPGNVLVDHTGKLRVLDFGLALQQEQARETVGTLAYMAPEVLQGRAVTPAADLYAAGIIAYEVLTGSHPFNIDEPTQLMIQTLNEQPDFGCLPEAFQPVIIRLLQKEPEARYGSAFEVIRALQTAVAQPSLPETGEVRESFLQAATFVGREEEIQTLTEALRQAQQGHGRFWLIGGESGVGKSRLLEEMRTEALVRGALVLRGQAVSEGGAPYSLFRHSLRQLSLNTPLSELEAGVIKPLAPDIAQLLERPIPDAPELEAEATQRRLLTVIERIFKQQKRPMVLIVEDLHWAEESLDILRHLTERLSRHPILIIGTYRDDERPDLPDLLPGMQVMKLTRFDQETVTELSVSMLGEEAGGQGHIVRLLMRETEGNVYFLVEVVRALAEEAGQLEQISQMTLPQHVFATGVQTVLIRRLDRVRPEARPLLKLAAIQGRQLDLPLLQKLAPAENLEAWLQHGNDTAVLEVKEQVWQFSHDKLRETLLARMEPAENMRLHRQVAETLEQLHPDDPGQALTLAFHWQMAGDATKEMPYRQIAGTNALANGANQQAVELLTRAFDLAVAEQTDITLQAHLLRLLGEAYMGLGDLPKARLAFAQAASLLHAPVPVSTAGWGSRFVFQFGRQLARMLIPARPTDDPDRHFRYRELLHSYRQLGEIYFLNNETLATVYASVRALNAAEKLPPGPEQAILYANMSVAAVLIPWHWLAERYRQKSLFTLSQLNPPNPQAASHANLALSIYISVAGDWHDSIRLSQLAADTGRQIGDYRMVGGAVNVQATGAYNLGHFEQAMALFKEVYDTAVAQNNLMQQGWGLVNQATCLLRLGRDAEQAYDMLTRALVIQHQVNDTVALLNIHASTAVWHWRSGHKQQALQSAAVALELLNAGGTSMGSYVGFHDVPPLYLSAWEAGNTAVTSEAHLALKRLGRYARLFPFARPIYQICLGWRHYLQGNPDKAQAACHQAIVLAHACQMPYEEGLAHYHLARFLPGNSPDKLVHFLQAEALWRSIHAQFMLGQLTQHLEK